jgi:hypothetical protein
MSRTDGIGLRDADFMGKSPFAFMCLGAWAKFTPDALYLVKILCARKWLTAIGLALVLSARHAGGARK